MRIGLLSDTHGYLDPTILEHFAGCDEVWHAGDVGEDGVLESLEAFKPLRAVYGNIDGTEIRRKLPLNELFEAGGMKVLITHIGGYPGRYTPRVRKLLDEERPGLYVCGHSHILKVMMDKSRGVLHMNPGACGRHGFHRMRTVLRFQIERGRVDNLEVIELGLRGALPPDPPER